MNLRLLAAVWQQVFQAMIAVGSSYGWRVMGCDFEYTYNDQSFIKSTI